MKVQNDCVGLNQGIKPNTKVLVMTEHDNDCSYLVDVFFVPDNFDQAAEHKQWREETFKPQRWRNQYGSGLSKYMGVSTISFLDWIRKKYDSVEFIEGNTD